MTINDLFIPDPKNGQKSVSLTLMVVSFVIVLIAGALEMAGVVNNTSLLSQIYFANSALYFGRRFQSSKGDSIEKENS